MDTYGKTMLSIDENFIKKTFESYLVTPRVVIIEKKYSSCDMFMQLYIYTY